MAWFTSSESTHELIFDNPLGVGGTELHQWAFPTRTFQRALFGVSPALAMAARLPSRWVSEPLHLAYLSYYAIIYGPAVQLARQRRRPSAVSSRSSLKIHAGPSSVVTGVSSSDG